MSAKLHILFLTQVLPYPLDAGPKVRAYYVLRHLAQRHRVTLVSFVRRSDPPESVAHLAGFCEAVHTVPMPRSRLRDGWHLARSLATGSPFVIDRDWVPEMASRIAGLSATTPFDVVHADQLWMARYALRARTRATDAHEPRLVLDQHNACYRIVERLAAATGNALQRALLRSEAHKMARYEVAACRHFDRVVWVTAEDWQAVEAAKGTVRAARGGPRRSGDNPPVPNSGVIPICGDPGATPAIGRKPGARRVTFVGGLHYPPNAQGVAWFAEQVFPRVLARVPDAVLTVVGKNPPVQLMNRGSRRANCEVTGYVADLRPYLEETAAFVVPLLAGGGMRVKIVDGWLWGLPVVSTTVGAEGIETRPGENLLLADSPEALAEATVRVLQDREEGERLGRAGRSWAEERYDWRRVYGAWDRVYEGLAASR